MLSMHPALFETLKMRAEKNAMTIQEAIIDAIRRATFEVSSKKSKAGRPKKIDDPFIEHFTRSR
ncbi:hypothetical protein J4219_01135 [Candidatus Woesearchaeota archaeon]|nr:hypothetical protein [Candidatus Woesearchaeota archaeon]